MDANGAYTRKQALAQAEKFAELGVVWFEEPVSADDLAGLHLIRDRGPVGMQIAAGEYGYDLWYFRRMLEAEAVDVLQADASRCAGITGFLRASALTERATMELSAHCAPCFMWRPAVRCLDPRTWSTSTIMRESNTCCLTVRSTRSTGRCDPIDPARGSDWS